MKKLKEFSPLIFAICVILLFAASIIPEVYQQKKPKPERPNSSHEVYTIVFDKNDNSFTMVMPNGSCYMTSTYSNIDKNSEAAVFVCPK